MKFSYNWLSKLVAGLDLEPAELGRLITMKAAECEGVEPYAPHLTAVRAARVIETRPLGKNVLATIDAGELGRRTVVCGAPNCRPGMVTAYVAPGVRLGGREIRKAVIQGVESDGMLASGAELGINRDHAGIVEFDLEPGQSLPFAPDWIIEIDNKSLTHRPDLWGHHGMAREVAAIARKTLRDPADTSRLPSGTPGIAVEIEDYALCPRYSALVFDNVTVQPSPLWLQYRLEAIGLNPINNIVDVTNFVMAELAQPMHAFDAAKLRRRIIVRSARPGERLAALNGAVYDLEPSNLVIADEGGAVAIAGVIGGLDSAITAGTTRIVFESANFQAASIRKTSSALKLRTDASMRFEKAQDPANTVRGLARAVALLDEVSPGIRLAGGLADAYRGPQPSEPIELNLDWLDRKLGQNIEEKDVFSILDSLQFGVTEISRRVLSVHVPSWRATKDISIKDDLVEEIGRMIGYGTITPRAPLLPVRVPPDPDKAPREYLRSVRDMAAAQGFHEVSNYSFLSEESARRFGFDPAEHSPVLNPISADQGLMRLSLAPGIAKNIADNARYSDAFRLFEIGREIHPRSHSLPAEVTRLAAAIYSKHTDGSGELLELKRLAECLEPRLEACPAQPRPFEHPSRAAVFLLDSRHVGRLFEFHPRHVESGRAAMLDLDLDALLAGVQRDGKYSPVRRYPSSAFDLSVITGTRELVGAIQRFLTELAGDNLESIEFLRQYFGPPLPDDKKSVSFRLTIAAPDRTLSAEEVAACRGRIIEGLRALDYELRI